MDTGRWVFLAVMIVIVAAYVAIMVPAMIRTKRDLDQADLEFRRYLAEYDRWMRGK